MRLYQKLLLLLCLFTGSCEGLNECSLGDVERPPPLKLWQDSRATFILHRVITHTIHDPILDYRLVLKTSKEEVMLLRGTMEAGDFVRGFSATRLNNGTILWHLHHKVCAVASNGKRRCNELPVLDCPSFRTYSQKTPEIDFLEGYHWLALSAEDVSIRLSAILALERLGKAKLAWSALQKVDIHSSRNTLRLWQDGVIARLTGQPKLLRRLRNILWRGGHCRRSILLASCIPEFASVFPQLMGVIPKSRPRWLKENKLLHQACRLRPAPQRNLSQ